jgi:hypothetical protein
MEVKKCKYCYRKKEYKINIKKDFICQTCRHIIAKGGDVNSYRFEEKVLIKDLNPRLLNEVKVFVDIINKQRGWATTKQIYVEMISLYNDTPKGHNESITLDSLSVGNQLMYMWNKLKVFSSGVV